MSIRVLIVEDNPADVRLIREYLAEEGLQEFTIGTAVSLEEARKVLQLRETDIVLLDLTLPDCRGLMTFHVLHSDVPDIPVIVLTGLDDDELALAAVRQGAQDYLLKGKFDFHLLTRTIRYTLERKRAEGEINRLAYYDTLTGLPNKVLFSERLIQAMQSCPPSHNVALLFLDIDNFKGVNDTLGHANGDLLLQEAASRIGHAVRGSDTVARVGGDEFIVMLSNIEAAEVAGRVANKVLDVLREPFVIEGHEIFSGASAGVALYPGDGDNMEVLLKHADIAMYQAKEMGKNNCQFFSPEMNDATQERQILESSLRRALKREEFMIFFQPQYDLKTGEITAVEALLRWNNPQKGVVLPGSFINIAEEIGLIIPLGDWVLRESCRQMKEWHLSGGPKIKVAVNISPRQFKSGDLVMRVKQALESSGLDPRYLELELTEGAVMDNPVKAAAMLNHLKKMGVFIAIDDFGTGYSSLSYLRSFPIDRLKIDKSFVQDLKEVGNDSVIVDAIIALARSLRLDVVAEGVEQDAQVRLLMERKCYEMQGFLFARPMPAEQCFRHLLSHAPPPAGLAGKESPLSPEEMPPAPEGPAG